MYTRAYCVGTCRWVRVRAGGPADRLEPKRTVFDAPPRLAPPRPAPPHRGPPTPLNLRLNVRTELRITRERLDPTRPTPPDRPVNTKFEIHQVLFEISARQISARTHI
jgi:hypothetical protein